MDPHPCALELGLRFGLSGEQVLQCHCPAHLKQEGSKEGYSILGESCCFLFPPVPTPLQPVLHPKVTCSIQEHITSSCHNQFLLHPIIFKQSKSRVLFENSCKDSGTAEIVAVAEMWERGRQRKCRRGAEELPCDSITELPVWDLQERASKLLRLGAKPKGIDSLPLLVLSFPLFVYFNVFLLNLAHNSVFPHPSEAQSLVRTQAGPVALRLQVVALTSS